MSEQIMGSLLGAVTKLPASGNHKPTAEELQSMTELPGDPEDGVAYTYCVGCGTPAAVNTAGLDALSRKANLTGRINLEGKYFQVQRCPLCGDEGFTHPKLTAI